ncbi:hypothetical protein [Fimbriiglobus ruber]|nr:hypothetical protein [Fimbriiglobus ruber]
MLPLDHLRGMTPGADATLAALAAGKNEVTLTTRGKLLVLVSRIAPWLIDHFAKKKIRKLFQDEITARKQTGA